MTSDPFSDERSNVREPHRLGDGDDLPIAESVLPTPADSARFGTVETVTREAGPNGSSDAEILEAEILEAEIVAIAAPPVAETIPATAIAPPRLPFGDSLPAISVHPIRVGSPFRLRESRRSRSADLGAGAATGAAGIGAWLCLTCWVPSSSIAMLLVLTVAGLGIGLGLWGLRSPMRRRAGIGIGLCHAGAIAAGTLIYLRG
ncbi:MAG TPA: hypothetical protein PLI18_01080 [Pirellulaceae bacterium]|nr:hypothetical protein [Pirellulaceae bacterium]